jgi:antitoxin (DNA-binding transcriptional repressor) of toxin-antitoxin stability system
MKTINVRDLQRNMKAVAAEVVGGERFQVLKNSRPLFLITPSPVKPIKLIKKKHTREEFFAALDKMRFHSGEKDLSERIDEIVYK